MNLTVSTQQAIKIVKVVGDEPGVSSKGIALATGISENRIRRLCKRMEQVSLMKVERGPKGGYTVQNSVTLFDLLNIFESEDVHSHNTGFLADQHLLKIRCDIIAATHSIYIF